MAASFYKNWFVAETNKYLLPGAILNKNKIIAVKFIQNGQGIRGAYV